MERHPFPLSGKIFSLLLLLLSWDVIAIVLLQWIQSLLRHKASLIFAWSASLSLSYSLALFVLCPSGFWSRAGEVYRVGFSQHGTKVWISPLFYKCVCELICSFIYMLQFFVTSWECCPSVVLYLFSNILFAPEEKSHAVQYVFSWSLMYKVSWFFLISFLSASVTVR